MSMTFIVSKHKGAKKWVKQQGFKNISVVDKLDLHKVQMGDTVIGILPIYVIASVCQLGAIYKQLHFKKLPTDKRYRSVSLAYDEFDEFGAGLTTYEVKKINDRYIGPIGHAMEDAYGFRK